MKGGKLRIGDTVFMNRNAIIVCRENITIGNNTSIGPNVCIYDHNHKFNNDCVISDFKTGNISQLEKNAG